MTAHLKPVVVMALNAHQDIADRMVGPVFSDEYVAALMDEDVGTLQALEDAHEILVSSYTSMWVAIATDLADAEGIQLYVEMGGDDPPAPEGSSKRLHERVKEKISVTRERGQDWKVGRV